MKEPKYLPMAMLKTPEQWMGTVVNALLFIGENFRSSECGGKHGGYSGSDAHL